MLQSIDQAMLWVLTPLAVAILISGLDDLVIDIAWAAAWVARKLRPRAPLFPPGPRQLDTAPIHRIAILLPLWHEAEVITQMVEHNLAAIRYPDYHIFAGAYPNDEATCAAVDALSKRFANVHLALCPHDGPTSKADCLNWIYQHVCSHEARENQRFDVLVTHDAEDLIHPDELRWINFYSTRSGDSRIFSADVSRCRSPADAMGDGDRAARLAEAWMVRKTGRDLLALARS